MGTHTARDLSRHTGEILESVKESGEAAVITRNGEAAAVLMPIAEVEDYVLATNYEKDMDVAVGEFEAGETVDLRDALKELEDPDDS